MPLLKTLQFIVNHPVNKNQKAKAVFRFLEWQFISRIQPNAVEWPFIEGMHFLVARKMYSLTMHVYCGLAEFEEMGFLLHFLRSEDLFVDVGANLGSYTILAAGVVQASTYSFEPVPESFRYLEKNVLLNKIQKNVKTFNIGLGDKKSIKRISVNLGPNNQITTTKENSIEVPIECLDKFTASRMPNFMKIDVQGYELPILKGMKKTLQNTSLKAFIIETDGSGKQYGILDESIHDYIIAFGFVPYKYNPITRQLQCQSSFVFPNTIYIKDLPFVQRRIKEANPFEVFGQKY